MPAARQNLRVLQGRFVLTRVTDVRTVAFEADLLALVLGPDGGAAMRRDDKAEDAWAALWNGDDAHDPEATGMLSAIVAPLAAGEHYRQPSTRRSSRSRTPSGGTFSSGWAAARRR
jgi:hypothetical protein